MATVAAPAPVAHAGGFTALSESEPVVEVNDVHENQFDPQMFFQAHPQYASALLNPAEVNALCVVAQQHPPYGPGPVIPTYLPINNIIVIFSIAGYELAIRVAGWVDTKNGIFSIQTFLSIKTPTMTAEIKGPKLDGTLNVHVGPIPIPLPACGNFDIWVKVAAGHINFTVLIIVAGNVIVKTFSIPFPLV